MLNASVPLKQQHSTQYDTALQTLQTLCAIGTQFQGCKHRDHCGTFEKYIFLLLTRTTVFVNYIFLRPAKTAVGRTFPYSAALFIKIHFSSSCKTVVGRTFPYSVALFIKLHFSSSRETNFTVATVPDIHFYSSRLKIAVFQHFFALFALF
jgi:hypothetical protein